MKYGHIRLLPYMSGSWCTIVVAAEQAILGGIPDEH